MTPFSKNSAPKNLVEHGSFADMPYDLYLSELDKHYGHKLPTRTQLVFDFSNL